MFTSKLGTPGSKFSPFSTNQANKSNPRSRRSVSLFTPQRKSPYTPRQAALNRSVQQTSQVAETSQHVVEGYGPSLPVQITEALTMADRNVESTMEISPNGWAWLVCGRRLFLWRYKHTQQGKTGQCRELMLPPSDLAHHANLITVLPSQSDPNMAACLAVSPEGVIRYWCNVSHEGSFAESNCDLKGEESGSLKSLQNNQCILATTTSTLLLIRVASGQTLHTLLPGPELSENCQVFYVLSGAFLQKWQLTDSTERLVFQCDADKLMRECLSDTVWEQDAGHLPNLKTWLIDIQLLRGEVVVLGAGVNPDVSAQLYYACGILHTESDDSPQSFLSFSVSQYKDRYTEEEEDMLIGYKLLVPDQNNPSAYMYDRKSVICITVSSSHQTTDRVDFQTPGDKLLGAGSYGGVALFFSVGHGLVSIKTAQQANTSMDTSQLEISSHLEASYVAPSRNLDEMSVSEDASERLKAAFLQSCSGNLEQAHAIIDELFPLTPGGTSVAGSTLDIMVSQLSQALIDDYPASDPRWAESVTKGGSTSNTTSLILLHQLEDKQKAHDFYITFLKKVNIWDRLGTVTVRDKTMSTGLLLCEHAEKLSAAVTLHSLHTQYTQLVDVAIRQLLEKKGQGRPANGLTTHDLFYREVSKIQEIFTEMYAMELAALQSDMTSKDLVSLVSSVNTITEQVLYDACQYRQVNVGTYQSQTSHTLEAEYVPWTSSEGTNGTRQLLVNLHKLTVEKAIPEAHDTETRGSLFQQLVALTDIILDGFKFQLESLNQMRSAQAHYNVVYSQYEQTRHKLLNMFVTHDQYERGACLAEKYCDFSILVQICENTNNQERLQRYMTQFQDKGFSDFVFKWYMEEGKRGKLLSQSFIAQNPALTGFLSSQENRFISWLHDINTNQLYKAHKTLKELADNEKDFLAKKKTLLSLSKLAALAADSVPTCVQSDIQAINDEHDLILHQEVLPAAVIQRLGYDFDNMKVMSPRELIDIYISDYNEEANEYDFKKALDLLSFVDQKDPDMPLENLKMHIWCRVILKDDWTQVTSDDPMDSCKNTQFMKLVELVSAEDENLNSYLPHVEELMTADELSTIRDNTNFQFLLRATYEYILRTYA